MVKKKASGVKVKTVNAGGQSERIKAEGLEVDFGGAGRIRIQWVTGTAQGIDVYPIGDSQSDLQMTGSARHVKIRLGSTSAQGHDVAADDVVLDASGDAPARAPVLKLRVQKALGSNEKAAAPRKHQIRRWASAAMRAPVADITIRLVGEDEGRVLNREYRDRDYATNVLTFLYEESPELAIAADGFSPLSGDLIICVPVVMREADKQGKALDAHFAHLVVHGILHLQGYDHVDNVDAERMESLEKTILATLGFPDPYA